MYPPPADAGRCWAGNLRKLAVGPQSPRRAQYPASGGAAQPAAHRCGDRWLGWAAMGAVACRRHCSPCSSTATSRAGGKLSWSHSGSPSKVWGASGQSVATALVWPLGPPRRRLCQRKCRCPPNWHRPSNSGGHGAPSMRTGHSSLRCPLRSAELCAACSNLPDLSQEPDHAPSPKGTAARRITSVFWGLHLMATTLCSSSGRLHRQPGALQPAKRFLGLTPHHRPPTRTSPKNACPGVIEANELNKW